jgi:hypothetical protein
VRPPGVERTLFRGFTAVRLGFAILGLVTVARERTRYRRPTLAGAAAALALTELAWSSRVDEAISSKKMFSSAVTPTVAALTSCVGVACAADSSNQFGDLVDWAYHLLLWSSALLGLSVDNPSTSGAVAGASVVTYAGVVRARTGRGSWPRAAANAWPICGFFIAARLLAIHLRSTDAQIALMNERALQAGAAAEIEKVRSNAMQELHQGALDSLRRIGELWPVDPRTARLVAGTEALRLRHVVHSGENHAHDLRSRLEELSRSLRRQRMATELIVDVATAVSREVTDLILTAAQTALLALCDADDDGRRCTVSVVSDDAVVIVRIRDHTTELEVAGLRNALEDVVAPIAGHVEVWSAPGRGTRIVVRVGSDARPH